MTAADKHRQCAILGFEIGRRLAGIEIEIEDIFVDEVDAPRRLVARIVVPLGDRPLVEQLVGRYSVNGIQLDTYGIDASTLDVSMILERNW